MVKIYVDVREKQSAVPKYLSEMGVTVIYRALDVGDYMVSSDTVVERKRIDDLAHSVFEGRFFDQVRRLKQSGLKTYMLVEGDLRYLRRVTSRYRSVEAALLTAVLYNDICVIYSRNSRHTAELIKLMAEKLQTRGMKHQQPALPTYRKYQKPKDRELSSWQLYILSSFPGIGPTLAERLLRKFGSLKAVLDASPSELSRVDGVTEEKAHLIRSIMEHKYSEGGGSGEGLSRFYGLASGSRGKCRNC